MSERYIPVSEDEQKFAAVVERVLTDKAFARKMQQEPVRALQQAGYKLSAKQRRAIKEGKLVEDVSLAIVRPVVKILTKGTKPVVRVITKGTAPAVNVVTNTVVAVRESKKPMLEVAEEEEIKGRRGSSS